MIVWRVFWVPQDAVRAGVRKRVLAGWEDLRSREDACGVRAGDAIFLSPDHRVDPLLSQYVQSAVSRRYTAETRRNYATDIALLLTFLRALCHRDGVKDTPSLDHCVPGCGNIADRAAGHPAPRTRTRTGNPGRARSPARRRAASRHRRPTT